METTETDPIFLEALHWFALMQDEGVNADQRSQFDAWLTDCPEHVKAYERAEALWARFDVVKPEFARIKQRKALNRRSALLGLAGVALAGGALWTARFTAQGDFHTGVAQAKTVALDDGSVVELGSYSSLSVAYSADARRLTLHHGQAFFSVAADAKRPFIVEADDTTIQALGTKFDVKRRGSGVLVTVIEHSVLVNSQTTGSLTIGEGSQIDTALSRAEAVKAVDISETQAWQRGRIIFSNTPLRYVLEELERYTHGKIVLIDPSIGDIPVTAVFNKDQANEALTTIEANLPIKVLNTAGLISFVYRK